MNKKQKVIIFGTSLSAHKVQGLIDPEKAYVVAYLDNDTSKINTKIKNITIYSPDQVFSLQFDYILLGSITFAPEMLAQLILLGVDKKVVLNPLAKRPQARKAIMKSIHQEYVTCKKLLKAEPLKSLFNDYAFCSMNAEISKRDISLYDFPDYLLEGLDFVRTSTIELLSREILQKNILGSVAELGVYQGNLAKLISTLFPTRTLYLFDTFEGFLDKDVEIEKDDKLSNARAGHLNDTNIEMVLSKIINTQRAIIKKGYFPDTAQGLDSESFAFVSLDVDLYKPTYEGLLYFYPRLAKGGYILIHDYNLEYYSGVKKAVLQFCDEFSVTPVPVCDYYGSAIITK